MNTKDLANKIEYFDNCYRRGEAKVSDKKFDHLEANLRRIDPNNSYFHQRRTLPSLDNGNYQEWLEEKILPDTRLIIEPKIDGVAIALSYEEGRLVKAITRKGIDKTESIKTIKNIPHRLPTHIDIQLRGELYGPNLSGSKSQALAAGHLRKKVPTGKGLSFCAFQIFNTELNHSSQLIELQQLGVEIPESETTNRTSQVDLYVQLWKEGKLFKQYPTDGIVIKINSRKLQKQLGENSVCPNWAFAVKG